MLGSFRQILWLCQFKMSRILNIRYKLQLLQSWVCISVTMLVRPVYETLYHV